MRRRIIRIRILCLTLPVLMALSLSACSLFGGKGEQEAQDAAETVREETLTGETGKVMPSDNREAEESAQAEEEAEAPGAEAAGEKPAREEAAGAKTTEEKTAGTAGEAKTPEREAPAAEAKKGNTPASSRGGSKEEEQVSQDDSLEPLPESEEAPEGPVQEQEDSAPFIDDRGDTLLPEVP